MEAEMEVDKECDMESENFLKEFLSSGFLDSQNVANFGPCLGPITVTEISKRNKNNKTMKTKHKDEELGGEYTLFVDEHKSKCSVPRKVVAASPTECVVQDQSIPDLSKMLQDITQGDYPPADTSYANKNDELVIIGNDEVSEVLGGVPQTKGGTGAAGAQNYANVNGYLINDANTQPMFPSAICVQNQVTTQLRQKTVEFATDCHPEMSTSGLAPSPPFSMSFQDTREAVGIVQSTNANFPAIDNENGLFIPESPSHFPNESAKMLKKRNLTAFFYNVSKSARMVASQIHAGTIGGEDLLAHVTNTIQQYKRLQDCGELKSYFANEPEAHVACTGNQQASEASMVGLDGIVVDGWTISTRAYALAYGQTEVKKMAVPLFEDLYNDHEKNVSTISGRICDRYGAKAKTPRLDPNRLNVIYHAVASIKKKKGSYYFDANDLKDLMKSEQNSIKSELSQRLNQIKQANKKTA